MSDAGKAVFLSYASQDSEAAKRIADALRGAGVEVWFDAEGGLEHGDEWDAKIRRQIKECVLFIPLISANTQAREEGYFRIEWELAAQRALGIASGVAFILPVLIDGTKEPEALVPDRFRSVQWTKLPGGNVPPDDRLYYTKDGRPVVLKKRIIVSGDELVDASAGYDQQTGVPDVNVTLNSAGARKMLDFTTQNVGKPMAVVYVDRVQETKIVDGKEVHSYKTTEEVISNATINGVFGKRFQTTGLGQQEAQTLAVPLRGGGHVAGRREAGAVELRSDGILQRPEQTGASVGRGVHAELLFGVGERGIQLLLREERDTLRLVRARA